MIRAKSENRSLKYFLKRLNGFLEADDLQMTVFDRTLDRFAKRFDLKIAVIDFKYFDERCLKKVRCEIEKHDLFCNYDKVISDFYKALILLNLEVAL